MSDDAGVAEIFGERLASARDARKISQSDLGKKAGLPASSISHFEGGARKPSFGNLHRLADALNVSTDYLLGRSEDIGTATSTLKLQRQLEKLSAYDFGIAEQFIEVLASKGDQKKG